MGLRRCEWALVSGASNKWGRKIDGAIGGGVITYTVQKVAVATGYVSTSFPAEIRRAKIAILGVEEGQQQNGERFS
jgi:hypothetical protein